MPDEQDKAGERPGRVELLAHDVRAAVADVTGGLRLLDNEDMGAEARTQLERVRAASELLSRLIEEVLTDGSGQVSRAVGAVTDLRRLLDDEMKRWRGAAMPQGIAVTRSLGDGLPHLLRIEALPLRRILANAMGNALRYAEKQVTLAAQVTADGDIEIAVCDDGPGFAPELLVDLFEPARRGDGSTGTGMGLHIAAGHAAALGGKLSARNAPDGGGEVVLTLPGGLAAASTHAARDVADLTGWRVLVADDSETVQTLVAGMMGQLGAECERAGDGIVALNWLARERFDLALIDVEMPLLGGREVIRAERLRQARGVAPPTPMISLTAHVSDEIREELLDEGADGVLIKPLPDTETFGRMLSGMIDLSAGRPDWRPEAAPAISAATLAELMMAAGPENAVEMLARMRDDLATVDTGLQKALESEDGPQVRFQTHVLLSLAGALGALPTQTLARRLNDLAREGVTDPVRITGQVCLARLRELRAELDHVT